jgi:hypothetical protein
LEGAHWDKQEQLLTRSLPKVLIEELPFLLITPIEAHKVKQRVSETVKLFVLIGLQQFLKNFFMLLISAILVFIKM